MTRDMFLVRRAEGAYDGEKPGDEEKGTEVVN